MRRLTHLSAMSLGLLIRLTPLAHADLALRMANAIKAALVRNHLRTEAELPCVTLVPEEERRVYRDGGQGETRAGLAR